MGLYGWDDPNNIRTPAEGQFTGYNPAPWEWDPATSRQPMSDLDTRISDLNRIYGDYGSALTGAQPDYNQFRQGINQFYGQPSAFSSSGPGGGWSSQAATGQYLPIEQALANANQFYGDQQTRYNTFLGDQQTRYEGLANQFLGMAQGHADPDTGEWIPGFYDTQYANAMGGANTLYDLGMGVMGDDGTRTGGFFADQYAGALGNADALRGLAQGYTDPATGEWVTGFYDNQYNTDMALNESLYGASTYDEDLGQWTGGAAKSLANTMYDASTSFASSIYDLAGGAFDDTGTRMGGFYQDQSAKAVSSANAAYNAAAAELVTTNETQPVLDESGQPVLDEAGEPVTEEIVSYQGGHYNVQEAEQIRRANMAQAQAVAQAAAVRAQQVQNATKLYNNAKEFFSTEKDAALGMLAAMEGVQVAPDASPEEIAAATGARGRYAQQFSFFGEQEQRGIAELARQIGVINAENVRRSGRVQTYEDLMRGRISEQEQALLERIGALQSAASTEMGAVTAAETQRLADLRSGYGGDVASAVAALQAQGIDPTELQAMTAQTGALLGAQEASQLAMLERLQRAETMLGSEQQLAARSMAGDARLALENQLFSTRAGIEEDIYGRLEGVERQKFGVGEGARGGQFQAGQTLSGALDELGREAYGYGAQARAGEFGARQDMQGSLGAAAIGESERVFDAGQRQAATIGAAQDAARTGIFQSGQQQSAAIAQANAMRDAGLFNAENAYLTAMNQALLNQMQGTTQAQMSYDQMLANAVNARTLGDFQSDVAHQGSVADALAALEQSGYQSDMWLGQQGLDAASTRNLGEFNATNAYYQSMFDAMEQAQTGRFSAGETAATGQFNAQQQADADERAVGANQFDSMMQLAMQEATGGAGLQGDLAQMGLTRDLGLMDVRQQAAEATAAAEQAAAAGLDVMQSWFAPGSHTEMALYAMGYTPESIAGFDNTTLRAIVDDYNNQVAYQQGHVQTQLPWDQNTWYNPETGDFRQGAAFEQQLGMDPEGAGMGLQDYAASLGFSPWQDSITYSNADFARGDLVGSFGYQQEPPSWEAFDQTTGVGFPLGTIGMQGPTLENLNALKQYGALQGYPYPTGEMVAADPAVVSKWYQDVIALSMGQPVAP